MIKTRFILQCGEIKNDYVRLLKILNRLHVMSLRVREKIVDDDFFVGWWNKWTAWVTSEWMEKGAEVHDE